MIADLFNDTAAGLRPNVFFLYAEPQEEENGGKIFFHGNCA